MESTSTTLGPDFIDGWRSLPTELHMEILSYVVPHNEILNTSLLYPPFRMTYRKGNFRLRLQTRLLWSLIDIPDFSAVTLDLLFGKNTFTFNHPIAGGDKWCLPPMTLANWFQHIEITISATWRSWQWLARFSQCAVAFRGATYREARYRYEAKLSARCRNPSGGD
jgi:hypothetical protein